MTGNLSRFLNEDKTSKVMRSNALHVLVKSRVLLVKQMHSNRMYSIHLTLVFKFLSAGRRRNMCSSRTLLRIAMDDARYLIGLEEPEGAAKDAVEEGTLLYRNRIVPSKVLAKRNSTLTRVQ